jgi:ABC-type antimicrobial peptide transport system permease subunit
MQTSGSISAFARILIALTLLLAPLAFGAVQPWAWGTIAVAAVCVLLLWMTDCVRFGSVSFIWSWLYVPAAVVLAVCAFQLKFGLTLDRYETREAAIKLISAVIIFFVVQQLFAETSPRAWRLIAATITIYAFAMALFAIIQFFASPGLIYGVIKPRWGGYIFGPYVYHNA